ncbi:hypothetical protein EC990672_5261B, partial [Escherichia coli 99.0672]
YGFFLVAVQP